MSNRASVAVGGETANSGNGVAVANGNHVDPEPLKWAEKPCIYERMLRAAHEVPKLDKDGDVKSGSGAAEKSLYKYISHDLVTMHAKRVLSKHGVYFMPVLEEMTQEGNRTVAKVNGHFINVDKPEDKIVYPGVGYGIDTSDKGPGKALSYACKYILAKALQMNTADDIEAENIKFEPNDAAAIKAEVKQDQTKTIQAWATSYKAALTNAKTLKELTALQSANKEQLMAEEMPDVTRQFFIDLFEQRKELLGGGNAA